MARSMRGVRTALMETDVPVRPQVDEAKRPVETELGKIATPHSLSKRSVITKTTTVTCESTSFLRAAVTITAALAARTAALETG